MIRSVAAAAFLFGVLALTSPGVSVSQEAVQPPASPTPNNAAAGSPAVPNPEWARKPSGNDMAFNYPRDAAILGRQGQVLMKCAATASGTLKACTILSESPAGQGFGDATLHLAPLFQMKAKTADGGSLEGAMVTIPVSWRIRP